MGIPLNQLPDHVKKRIKENPTDYRPVGGLPSKKSQSNQGRERQDSSVESGPRRCGFRIQLICVRRRLLDAHDNLRSALKPCVDRITFRLGFDNDADPLLQWSYGQTRTMGHEGVVILIEPL